MVLAVPLLEASAKMRTGFAVDDENQDYDTAAWTGVLPLKGTPQTPLDEPRSKRKIPVPENIANYARPQEGGKRLAAITAACYDAPGQGGEMKTIAKTTVGAGSTASSFC